MPSPSLVGYSAFAGSSSTAAVTWPTGIQDGDLGFLAVGTAIQAYTLFGMQWHANRVYTGTSGAAGGVSIELEYGTVYASTSGTTWTVSDSGSYTTAQLFVFRGWNSPPTLGSTSVDATATNTITAPGISTSVPAGSLVIHFIGIDYDGSSSASAIDGALVNSDLDSLTLIDSNTISSGVGGGIAVITGIVKNTGTVGSTTTSSSTQSCTRAYRTIVLEPVAASEAHFEAAITSASAGSAGLTAQIRLNVASTSESSATGILNVAAPFPIASVSSTSTVTAELSTFPFVYAGYTQSQSTANAAQLGSFAALVAKPGLNLGVTSRGRWLTAPSGDAVHESLTTAIGATPERMIFIAAHLSSNELFTSTAANTQGTSSTFSMTLAEGIGPLPVFIAFSGSDIYSSSNGASWTLQYTHSSNIYRIQYVNGEFIALSDTSTTAARSSNGTSWTTFTLPNAGYDYVSWVGYAGGVYFKQAYYDYLNYYYLSWSYSLTGTWSGTVYTINSEIRDIWYSGSAWLIYTLDYGSYVTIRGSTALNSGWGPAAWGTPDIYLTKFPYLRVGNALVGLRSDGTIKWTTDGADWFLAEGSVASTIVGCTSHGPNGSLLVSSVHKTYSSEAVGTWVEEITAGFGASAKGSLTFATSGMVAHALSEPSATGSFSVSVRFFAALSSVSTAIGTLPGIAALVAAAQSISDATARLREIHQLFGDLQASATAIAALLVPKIAKFVAFAKARASAVADFSIHVAQHLSSTDKCSSVSSATAELTAYGIPILSGDCAGAAIAIGNLRTAIRFLAASNASCSAQAALTTGVFLSASAEATSVGIGDLNTEILFMAMMQSVSKTSLRPYRSDAKQIFVQSNKMSMVTENLQRRVFSTDGT
jgi:hypothetical protein